LPSLLPTKKERRRRNEKGKKTETMGEQDNDAVHHSTTFIVVSSLRIAVSLVGMGIIVVFKMVCIQQIYFVNVEAFQNAIWYIFLKFASCIYFMWLVLLVR
jgi:hypothetical protein